MIADKIFVGRKKEWEQFTKVLEDPKDQSVLVFGKADKNVVCRNAVFVNIAMGSTKVD